MHQEKYEQAPARVPVSMTGSQNARREMDESCEGIVQRFEGESRGSQGCEEEEKDQEVVGG